MSPSEQIGYEDEQQREERRGASNNYCDDVSIFEGDGLAESIGDTDGAASAADGATLAEMCCQDAGGR